MENRNEGGSYYLVHSYTWDTGEKVDTSGKEWGISRHEYRTRKETRESERILSAKTDEEALLEAGEIVKKTSPELVEPYVVYKYILNLHTKKRMKSLDEIIPGETFVQGGRKFMMAKPFDGF